MSNYTIRVTDGSRDLDAEKIRWELDGFRKVRVLAQFDGGDAAAGLTKFDTRPQVWVKITETDEVAPGMFAVIELPENLGLGGVRTEYVPALMDVIAHATRVAAEANERLAVED